jgi:hypothetical protein
MIQNCDLGLLLWVAIRSGLFWGVTPYSLVHSLALRIPTYANTAAAGSSQRLHRCTNYNAAHPDRS